MAAKTMHDDFLDLSTYKNLMVDNSAFPIGIVGSYILFTKFVGPSIMKSRHPYKLQKTLIIFNAFLVAANAYVAFNVSNWTFKHWNYRCSFRENEHYTDILQEIERLAFTLYYLKYAELMDTIFFVLRKKQSQISFLHVFHHSIVCLYYWHILKNRTPGFYMFVMMTINCYVHVIMYFYYALAACGPVARKYLWWKKYLTTIQIVQFFTILIYMTHTWIAGCESLDFIDKSLYICVILIMALFLNFYVRTFSK